MHMGLSNDPEEHYRAELMSHFILRKIPNTITEDYEEVFNKKTESKKLQATRASMVKFTPLNDLEPLAEAVSNLEGEAVPSGKKQQIEAVAEDDARANQSSKSTKLTVVSLWPPNKVAPASDSSGQLEQLELVDMEATGTSDTQPTASRRTKPTNQSFSQQVEGFTPVPVAIRAVSLKELFCSEAYVFKSFGLSSTDAMAAYTNIIQAGCTSSEELLHYLDEHKQYRVCNCGFTGTDGMHPAQCSSRVAGVWTEGLTTLNIPAFHAVKIIQAVKAELK